MIRPVFFAMAFWMVCQAVRAVGQAPHLEGKVTVSVKSGTIDAELTLKGLPKTDDYTIWLNSGLNIEYFRDIGDRFNFSYNTEYDPERSSEALQHYFPSSDGKGRYLPEGLVIKYTGKFPVIGDTAKAYDWGDWKGNIAFNGKTVRASEQSAWYPVVYLRQEGVVIDKYTYNIELECPDCQTLYLNGDVPQKAARAFFKSDEAVPLLLFAGGYDYRAVDKIFVLNADLGPNKLNTLAKTTGSITAFYENILKTPYGKPVVYISTTPVSKKNEWMFVTYPSIAVVGIDQYKLDNYFDDQTYAFKQKSNITFIAHELAHYYIGTLFVPNGELRWFFLEGLADYLSIKAAKELLGEEIYRLIVQGYISQLKDFRPVPLGDVTVAGEIGETYRYRYAPLLLLAIEREIGEEKMYKWIGGLVNGGNQKTDYVFFTRSLQEAGVTEAQMALIEEMYIFGKDAAKNIFKKIE